jgi:hypothetical protein
MNVNKLLVLGMMGNSSGNISKICPSITPTSGGELLTNGDMETGSPPTGWIASASTLARATDERTGGVGSYSLSIARNGSNFFQAYRKGATAVGDWVKLTAWYKRIDAAQVSLTIQNDTGAISLSTIGSLTDTTWTPKTIYGRAIDTNCRAFLRGYSTGADGVKNYYDGVSMTVLSFASCISKLTHRSSSNGTFSCTPTVAIGSVAGMLVNYLDANNFVMVLVDRTGSDVATVVKRVAGTYATATISGAINYGAAKVLKVIVNGSSYNLYYGGTQVGTTQTIADALGKDVYGFTVDSNNMVGLVATSSSTNP